MNKRFHKLLNINYPQNYIIRHPYIGAIIITMFCFGFSVLYKPSEFHASKGLSYETTMAIYGLIAGLSVILNVMILKNIRWFADINDWTLLKELLSALFVLFGMGIVVYLSGFILETSEQRLRIPTFLKSIKNVTLVGVIPFTFFTSVNYRYLFSKSIKYEEYKNFLPLAPEVLQEDIVHVISQLKKEELSFYPSQFMYAESYGNYVIFYLNNNNLIKKQIIRNSISNIDQQLSAIPYFLRTHRSFIVNLKKIKSKQGNILGYQVELGGTESKIPVSRNKIDIFNKLFAEYRNN